MTTTVALREKVYDPRSKFVRWLSIVLHGTVTPIYVYAIAWHFIAPRARTINGYYLFGWFYRYLTFCTFNFQAIQLIMALLSDLFPNRTSSSCKAAVGCMSCVALCATSTVTTMYYVIRTIDPTGLDDPRTRVVWLNNLEHIWNSVVAWCDIWVSFPRSFSPFDRNCVVVYTIVYSTWLLAIKFVTDSFPYPFLNNLPPIAGWFFVCFAGSCLMLSFFNLGRLSKQWWTRRENDKVTS